MTAAPKATMREILKAAYIEGWRRSLEGYAIWKNGEQLTAMGRRARDEMAKAEEVAGPEFEVWLEKQKEAYGRDE